MITIETLLKFASALLSLLASLTALWVALRKIRKVPNSKESNVRQDLRTLGILVILAIATGGAYFIIHKPRRTVEIREPIGQTTLRMERVRTGDVTYTFPAKGRCADCTETERIQLMVFPPQEGVWVPQSAVLASKGDWVYGKVYIGDSNNPIHAGETIRLRAIVVDEDDVIALDRRPRDPRDAPERGLSEEKLITVESIQSDRMALPVRDTGEVSSRDETKVDAGKSIP